MTSALKSISKKLEGERSYAEKVELVTEYAKKFHDWLSNFVGKEQKWSLISQKPNVLKYIRIISEISKNSPRVMNNNIATLSNIGSDLITLIAPGNDPEIRKEVINASFDIITMAKDVIPIDYWRQYFFNTVFSTSLDSPPNLLVYIGDNKPVTYEEIAGYSYIFINKVQEVQEKDRSILNFWWSILCGSLIPFIFTDNEVLDDKQRYELKAKIVEIFALDMKIKDSELFIGPILDHIVVKDSELSNSNRCIFNAAILILNHILKKANSKKITYTKYTSYLESTFRNVFQVSTMMTRKESTGIDKNFSFLYTGQVGKTHVFGKCKVSSLERMKIVTSMVVKLEEDYFTSLENLFHVVFMFYMHFNPAWMGSKTYKKAENREKVTLQMTDLHMFTMSLAIELMKVRGMYGPILDIICSGISMNDGFVLFFLLSLMINIKKIDRDKFIKCLMQIPDNSTTGEIVDLFTAIIAFEDFRIKENIKDMEKMNSAYEVFKFLAKQSTNLFSFSKLLTLNKPVLIITPLPLTDMTPDEIDKFKDDFMECISCISEGSGYLSYAEMWYLLFHRYYKSDKLRYNYKCKYLSKTLLPNIIKIQENCEPKAKYLRSIGHLLTREEIYCNLDPETISKWIGIVTKKLINENDHTLLIVYVDCCTRLFEIGEVRIFPHVDKIVKVINYIISNASIPGKIKVGYMLKIIDILTVASALPAERFKSIFASVGNTLFNVAENVKDEDAALLEKIGIINFIFIIMIIHIGFFDNWILALASQFPTLLSLNLSRIFPMLADIAKNCSPDVISRLIKPLDNIREDYQEKEKLYNISLLSAMLLLELPGNKSIKDVCIPYVSEKYGDVSFNIFSNSFQGRSKYINFDKKLDNTLISCENVGNEKVSLETQTLAGKNSFTLELEENKTMVSLFSHYNLSNSIDYLKPVLFPTLEAENSDTEKILLKVQRGVLIYVKKGQYNTNEAVENGLKDVSRQFLLFAKSIGTLKKNGNIDWNFYSYKVSLLALPVVSDRSKAEEAFQKSPIAIIWNDGQGTFSFPSSLMNNFKCAIILKPFPNNFVSVTTFEIKEFSSVTRPLMNRMIVTKSLLPIFLRWSIISMYYDLKSIE